MTSRDREKCLSLENDYKSVKQTKHETFNKLTKYALLFHNELYFIHFLSMIHSTPRSYHLVPSWNIFIKVFYIFLDTQCVTYDKLGKLLLGRVYRNYFSLIFLLAVDNTDTMGLY